ncbi:MAG: hypothetical protein M3N47_00835 [Chloroflexota bacterium]|nr:hypothetical protein [Chloroflexota bacterium]
MTPIHTLGTHELAEQGIKMLAIAGWNEYAFDDIAASPYREAARGRDSPAAVPPANGYRHPGPVRRGHVESAALAGSKSSARLPLGTRRSAF